MCKCLEDEAKKDRNFLSEVVIRGQFQNQPLIGCLKKYKIENKTLLYGTVTYITALLLHIVAINI